MDVYETFETPFVYRIEVRDVAGVLHEVWAEEDLTTCAGVLSATWPETPYPVSAVRIHTAHDGWEQIDAVRLIGSDCE